MAKKKEKKIDLNHLEPEEKLKYEVAEELGLLDRVLSPFPEALAAFRNERERLQKK